MKTKFTIELDEQEICDVLGGLERLKEHAANARSEQRFQVLWEKITDIFEERV